jgi:hypothetical protein
MYVYQIFNFLLWNEQKGKIESAKGEGRPSKKDAWSVKKNAITIFKSI